MILLTIFTILLMASLTTMGFLMGRIYTFDHEVKEAMDGWGDAINLVKEIIDGYTKNK